MASQIEKGIKAIQKEVKTIKDKLEKFIKDLTKIGRSKPAKKAASKQTSVKKATAGKKSAPAKKKPAPKKTVAKKATAKAGTDFASVVEIIGNSESGIDAKALMEKTGFDAKKISNIVFKARNKGLIKAISKGVYAKA